MNFRLPIKQKVIISLISIFLSLPAFSSSETGEYFIQRYSPQDYNSNRQIWTILQDSRGVMYFGTTTGFVEFDGTNFHTMASPNHSTVRSLVQDSQGKIYYGAVDDMGMIGCDNLGHLKTISLKEKMPSGYSKFQDVWRVETTSHGVYFFLEHQVFRLFNGRFERVFEDMAANLWSSKVDDTLFILSNNYTNGLATLYVVKHGEVHTLPHFQVSIEKIGQIRKVLPYPGNKLLLCLRETFYLVDLDQISFDALFSQEDYGQNVSEYAIQPMPDMPFDDYLEKNMLFTCEHIKDYQYAVGTLAGGIGIVDFSSGEFNIVNKEKGLSNDRVWSLFLDNNKNLWAGTDNGISHIEISSPVTKFTEASGISTQVNAVTRHNGELYVGLTPDGVYYLPGNHSEKENNMAKFRPVENFNGRYCLNFISIGDHLLMGSDTVIDIVNKQSTSIDNTEPTLFFGQSDRFPEYLFLGLSQHSDGGVGYLNITDFKYKGKLPGINEIILQIASDEPGNLWLTTRYKGLIYIRFKGEDINDFDIIRCTTENGLPRNDNNYVYVINNEILAATAEGIYKGLQTDTSENGLPRYHFSKDTSFDAILDNGPILVSGIYKYNEHCYLIQTAEGFGFACRQSDGNFFWNPEYLKMIEPGNGNVYIDSDKVIWIPNNKGLFRYSPTVKKDYKIPYPALIRKVTTGSNKNLLNGTYYNDHSGSENGYSEFSLKQPETLIPTIEYRDNELSFEYSACFYEQRQFNRYQYILDGFDKKWSNWSADTKTKYTNIPEGDYCFKIKAKNIYGLISSTAEFSFSVTPPWYRTYWAYSIYLMMSIGVIYFAMVINSKRLIQEQKRLESIVKDRTEELIEKNHELEKLSIVARETDNSVIITDADGDLEWVNHGFIKFYGYTKEEYIAEKGKNIFSRSVRDDFKTILEQCRKDKVAFQYESQIITKDGGKMWVQTALTPILNHKNEVIRFVFVEADITKLKTAYAEMKQLSLTKELLLSIFVHDMKNPLQALLGMAGVLIRKMKKGKTDDIISYGEKMLKSSTQISELVDNLHLWVQSQNEGFKMDVQHQDITQIAEKVIELMNASAEFKHIRIVNNIEKKLMLNIDDNMIRCIFRNLISNAIKFSHEHSEITLESHRVNRNVKISVNDHGVGMTPDKIDMLLNHDHIQSTPGTSKEKGTGLGIKLCRDFAEKHNGSLDIESTPGKGSTFSIILPMGSLQSDN